MRIGDFTMTSASFVVLLRGVNVGGHRVFKPVEFARKVPGHAVTSVGAAGTFIVRGALDAGRVREAFAGALPFEADVMVCPADEVLRIVKSDPFGPGAAAEDVKREVSVLAKPLGKVPPLPLERPPGQEWEVRVVQVTGRYAFSLRRRVGPRLRFYTNEVVEKELGVPATTRGWDTMRKVAAKLAEG